LERNPAINYACCIGKERCHERTNGIACSYRSSLSGTGSSSNSKGIRTVSFVTAEADIPDAVRVYLQPVEGFGIGETPIASAAAGGRFVMREVVPDKYRVVVTGLPAGAYLKSILVAGQERPDGSADIAGSAPIEIVLALGAAQLTGSVTDSEGKPASEVELTLFPESPERQRRRDLFRVTTSDQDGQFRFTDVAPGDYKVLAWQNLEAGAIQDPEFRRQFEAKAKSVSLGINGQESVELKEIPAEEIVRVLGR